MVRARLRTTRAGNTRTSRSFWHGRQKHTLPAGHSRRLSTQRCATVRASCSTWPAGHWMVSMTSAKGLWHVAWTSPSSQLSSDGMRSSPKLSSPSRTPSKCPGAVKVAMSAAAAAGWSLVRLARARATCSLTLHGTSSDADTPYWGVRGVLVGNGKVSPSYSYTRGLWTSSSDSRSSPAFSKSQEEGSMPTSIFSLTTSPSRSA
mmetsp:Transcript_53209/g.140751  ORF Transcript_53209/g.140751 Transcript_53209/m.140751 type:complete len:204 (+) Transcript_53209:152-763(+)